MMARSNLKQQMNESLSVGFSHSRSSSQPTFFTNNSLPPLSPLPPSESSMLSSNSNLKDVSMEEIDVSSRGPPRRGHYRSNSDVPLGFSAMIMSSPQLVPISSQGTLPRTEASGNDNKLKKREMDYGGTCDIKPEGEVVDEVFNSWMNFDEIRALNSGGVEGKDKLSTIIGGENSNIRSEGVSREGVKRSATGDIAPPARHYRSLSMDSALGKFHSDDESAKLQASSIGHRVDQISPSNSFKGNSAQLNLDFGYGEFNDVELKKIMGDERLAEIAVTDPKRAKRYGSLLFSCTEFFSFLFFFAGL